MRRWCPKEPSQPSYNSGVFLSFIYSGCAGSCRSSDFSLDVESGGYSSCSVDLSLSFTVGPCRLLILYKETLCLKVFLLLIFTMLGNPACTSLTPQLLGLCGSTLFSNFQMQSSQPPPQGTARWGSSQSPQPPSFPASETAISFLLLPSYQVLYLSLCLKIWGGGREFQGTQHRQHLKVAYLLPLPISPVATHHFLTLNLSVAAGLFSDFRGLTFQLRLKDFLRSPSLFTLSPSVSPFPFRPCGMGVGQAKCAQKRQISDMNYAPPLGCEIH